MKRTLKLKILLLNNQESLEGLRRAKIWVRVSRRVFNVISTNQKSRDNKRGIP